MAKLKRERLADAVHLGDNLRLCRGTRSELRGIVDATCVKVFRCESLFMRILYLYASMPPMSNDAIGDRRSLLSAVATFAARQPTSASPSDSQREERTEYILQRATQKASQVIQVSS